MKKALFLIILLALPLVSADAWLFDSRNLLLSLDVSSSMHIEPTSTDYSLNRLTANLSFYPRNSLNQEVISLTTSPIAKEENNVLYYHWESPTQRELRFSLSSRIRTNNNILGVKKKIPFPLTNIPEEYEIYRKPTDNIDSDNLDIIRLASELAKGEDDLNVVVNNIAVWTRENIEYNLSTLTASVSQRSSWVLKTKQGVCDELTNLFIAQLRSLGIPAKFISGIAYTNSEQFEEKWGPHGWAEVYFPGIGWIPFDITYGEFGFIDLSHIKLKEAIDAEQSSTKYLWVGNNVEIETEELKFDINLDDKIGSTSQKIDLEVKPFSDSVGFGSYQFIESVVTNNKPYYVSTILSLSKPIELELIGSLKKYVLLKPNEVKNVFWTVKIENLLDPMSIYTFPVAVFSLTNISSLSSFNSNRDETVFSLSEINEIIRQRQEQEQKTYSSNVDLNCTLRNNDIYVGENIKINCRIKNSGNIYLEGIDVCLKESCNSFDLGISQEKEINFSLSDREIGKRTANIKAKNSKLSRSSIVNYEVLDKPDIEIIDLSFPEIVEYNTQYEISFTLKKESLSTPKNVEVSINFDGIDHEWVIEELTTNQKFQISFFGKDMISTNNQIQILVVYSDNRDNQYQTKKDFNIILEKLSFTQRIMIFLNKIAKKLLS